MTDSTSNVSRPRFGQGGRLYREESSPAAAAMGAAREAIEDQRVAEMMAPDPPPWADAPEPPAPQQQHGTAADVAAVEQQLPPKKPKRRRRGKPEPELPKEVQQPAHMKVGKIEAPPQPKAPFDRREAVSTMLELAGIGLLVTTGFLIAVWVGTLIAGLSLVVLGVATSRNIGG